MYDTVIVRIALIIYVVIAGSVVFLLGRNSAAPDSLKNVGILIASILPVLIAVLPYLNPEKIEKHFTFALFYDAKDKKISRAKIKDNGGLSNIEKSSFEEMEKSISTVTIPSKVFIKERIFEDLRKLFGKDIEILVNY